MSGSIHESNAEVKQISPLSAAVLQIIPGAFSLPAFAILAYILSEQSVPNIFALGITILVIEVPVTWALIVRHVKSERDGEFSFANAFPWNDSIRWWQYVVIGIPMIIISILLIGAVGPLIERALLDSVFRWVPGWFVMRPDPSVFASLSPELSLSLWLLMLVSMVLLGGITQELYSRGFLLPRTEHLGRWAPAFNALVFAVFHMIAPWSWPAFFLMTLPWAYLVWWRRSVGIGLFIHVGMLTLQWIGMTMLVFGFVRQ